MIAVLYGKRSGPFFGRPAGEGDGAEHERGVEPAPHHPAVVGPEVVREGARQRVRIRRLRPDDQLGAGALQLGRGALVQDQEARELRRIPLLDDADVGLHQARAHLGRGGTAPVDLVNPQRAVAEVADEQHGHRHQRAPGRPAAARGGEDRVRDRAGERQHERGDAERPGHVGDLDDRRHERLRDRQVVGEDLRHQELDGDHDQRRQQHERRAGPVPGPPHAPGEEGERQPLVGDEQRHDRQRLDRRHVAEPLEQPVHPVEAAGVRHGPRQPAVEERALGRRGDARHVDLRHRGDPHERPEAVGRDGEKQEGARQHRQPEP